MDGSMKGGIVCTLILILVALGPGGLTYAGDGRTLTSGEFINLGLNQELSTRLPDILSSNLDQDDLVYKSCFTLSEALYGQFTGNLPSASSSSHTNLGILPQRNEIDFGTVAPHVGIGWGHEVGEARRWVISFDFGLAYQGTPRVDVTSWEGLLSVQRSWAKIENPKESFEDQIRNPEPLIAFGLTYKF
ncbi:MAG: hypothetical protein V1689_01080 [Pseudomonadota bacterium]